MNTKVVVKTVDDLKQQGCVIENSNNQNVCVTYKGQRLALLYEYSSNEAGKFSLRRVSPYAIELLKEVSEAEMIAYISQDIGYYLNATKSKNIESFIKINTELIQSAKQFESLFLTHNVQTFHTEIILQKIEQIQEEIKQAMCDSENVDLGF